MRATHQLIVDDLFGQYCLSCALGKDFEELQGTRLRHDFQQLFIMAAFAMTMGKTAAALPHHHERTSLFFVDVPKV